MNMQSMEIWQALRDYWTSLEVARWVESRFFLRRHHQLKSYGQASAGYPIALNTNGEIDTSFMPDALLRDGSRTLTADWDIGDNQRVLADGVRARDGAGLRLEDDAGNLGVFVEDGGDVGIGTATPSVKLDVAGAITASGVITGDGSGLTTLNASNISSGTLADARFTNALLRDGTRTLTADWDIGDNRRVKADGVRARDGAGLRLEDDAGNLGVFVEDGGQVGIGTTTSAAKLTIYSGSGANDTTIARFIGQTGAPSHFYMNLMGESYNNVGTAYTFRTVQNAASPVDVLTIRDDGKVGIGTTSPGEKLQIADFSSNASHYLYIASAGGSVYKQGVKFRHFSDDFGFTIEATDVSPEGFNIIRHQSSAVGVSALWINRSNGNVGIGTTGPGATLDVNGNARIASSLGVGSLLQSAGVASFKGEAANQLNIAHAGNSGWGLLITNSDGTYTTGYHTSTSGADNSVALVNVNNDALHLGTNNAVRVTVDHTGNVGIGTTSPQGALHVKDGDGYYLVKYVSPINSATPIVVIPNGAGDVTKIIQFEFVVTDGTNSTASSGSRTPGGAVVDATLGTNTFRMTVNADGSVDVRRQAGTGTLSAMFEFKWI